MKFTFDKRFQKKLQGRFGKYEFEVGVLNNGPHKPAKRGKDNQTTYAGGPRRKVAGQATTTLWEVSAANRERLGFNYLAKPFEKKSSDIIKFSREFLKLAFGKSEKKRLENLLQAIVRNPILRKEYGPNSPLTQKIKGFDRAMIDTAQLFKSIRAACTVKSGK